MTKLRPFQVEGVKMIYGFKGRALVADEQGLGKTIQALDWIRRIPKRRPVVIVCPSSVKYNWQAEAAMHFGMRTEVLEGRSKVRRLPPGDIFIVNYEILAAWLPLFKAAKVRVVVLDEVHYITNHTALRTKAVYKLVKTATSVIGMSGTPLTNRPIELWSVLKAIRPDLFPNREKYAWTYCKPRWGPWGWQYDGASNKKKLHKILKREVMYRRLKKDVAKELPEKNRCAVSFKLGPKATVEYNKAQHDFLGWLRKKSPARANRAKRSPALTKIGYLFRLVAELKLNWTEKWIQEFLISHPGEKLVCLTMHTSVINHLAERFRGRCVVINGSVTGKARHDTVKKFQTHRGTDLLFGNWKAAGVGITLTSACHGAALDYPWTPGALAQGEDRLHRIGQLRKVMWHYLVALGTIEEKQIKLLRLKDKILAAILDGDEDAEDFNFFDALLAEMKKAAR